MSEWRYEENHITEGCKELCIFGAAAVFLTIMLWEMCSFIMAALNNVAHFLAN
jgi:hypothetical protein